MTVVNGCVFAKDRSGVRQFGVDEYEVPWIIETDDPLDGPATVSTWGGLPQPGEAYSYFGEVVPNSFLLRANAQQLSKTLWRVNLVYGDIDQEAEVKRKEDGTRSDNPVEWAPTVDITDELRPIPAYSATFLGARRKGAALASVVHLSMVVDDTDLVPQNTAGVPHYPALEDDEVWSHLTVTLYRANYDWAAFKAFKGKINDADVTFTWPGFDNGEFEKRSLRCNSIGGNWQYINDTRVWRITYQFTYRPSLWIEEVLSQGFEQWIVPAPAAGQPQIETIVLPNNVTPGTPVKLGMDGRAILSAADMADDTKHVWMNWLVKGEVDFTTIPNLDGAA